MLPEPRPLAFTDSEYMHKLLQIAEQAEIRMEEKQNEQRYKMLRKQRLKEFDDCLRQFLNDNCGSNYKIKINKADKTNKIDKIE